MYDWVETGFSRSRWSCMWHTMWEHAARCFWLSSLSDVDVFIFSTISWLGHFHYVYARSVRGGGGREGAEISFSFTSRGVYNRKRRSVFHDDDVSFFSLLPSSICAPTPENKSFVEKRLPSDETATTKYWAGDNSEKTRKFHFMLRPSARLWQRNKIYVTE